jgi:hypothetical protein
MPSSEIPKLSSARPGLVLCSNCERVLQPQYHIGTPSGPSNLGCFIYSDSRTSPLRALRESASFDCPLCVILWDSFNDHIGDSTDIWADEEAFSIRLGMFQRDSSSTPAEASSQEYFLRYDFCHSQDRILPFRVTIGLESKPGEIRFSSPYIHSLPMETNRRIIIVRYLARAFKCNS